MKELKSAEFVAQIWNLTEPVVVARYNEVRGTWYPAGTEPVISAVNSSLGRETYAKLASNDVATTETLKPLIRQDQEHVRFGKSRAVPKPGSKK